MTRKPQRTQRCSSEQAQVRRQHAELYLEVAQLVLETESGDEATMATGNAVLAGIAAADAICCASVGARYRGTEHRQAAAYLEKVTGDRKLAGVLRDLVDLKDAGHYGLSNIAATRAKAAVRKASQLVEAARSRAR